MTPQEKAAAEAARDALNHMQEQYQAERARAGERDVKPPRRTTAQLAAWQQHVTELWEAGGRQKRGDVPEMACETCKGARWLAVRQSVPPRTVPCPACFYEWQAGQIRRRWPLSPKEIEMSEKPFRARRDAPQMANAYKTVRAFAERVIEGEADMLSITGPVGIGKSHLMLSLAGEVMAAGRGVIYRTATHIQRHLQNFGHDPESRREADARRAIAMQDLTRVPLLILDEAEKATGEWFANQMLDVINIRRNNRLATALAGNDLYLLPAPVLSRAQAKGCDFLSLAGVPDARPVLEGA
jgi:DNA replication protein DnaC